MRPQILVNSDSVINSHEEMKAFCVLSHRSVQLYSTNICSCYVYYLLLR